MSTAPPPGPLPDELARLIDALCDEFEVMWDDRRPAIEEYLLRAPDAARPTLLRELLLLELELRGRAGDPMTEAEARRRFGPLGPWVEPLVADLFPLAPPTSPLRVTLTVTDGPHRGAVFAFDRHDTFLVGRAPDAHVRLLDDPYFSRLHFLIEVNPPLCRLLDLKSRNGTRVNGRAVSAADLANGDEVRAGTTVLRVSIPRPQTGLDPAATLSLAALSPTISLAGSPRAGSAEPGTPAPARPVVPAYAIERQLGEGGMGVVWLARREADGTAVAVKTIRPAAALGREAVQRFLREAAILRRLDHPHIVAFRDQGEAGGLLYFVMDYVPGTDAGALLRDGGPLAVDRAVGLVCQLLEALEYAHGLGLVHRDVKPSNLLVTAAGGREVVQLADFGLARAYHDSPLAGLTLTDAVGGTPAFMPPEQVSDFRLVRPAGDQYAAAATLYALLTGQTVHGRAGSLSELFRRVLLYDPEPLAAHRLGVPAGLAAAVHRGLARRPEDRFPDVAALRRALLPFA